MKSNQKQNTAYALSALLWTAANRCRIGLGILFLTFTGHFASAETEHLPSGPWAEWVESDFPFFSSVVDARGIKGFPANNLTPRGLVLNLGHDCWACFDTELLRISAIWTGKSVTPEALAPLSYHDAGLKTLDGQTKLPIPDGQVWLANGIYPGWQIGEHLSLTDPREPAPSPEEVGRGALPESIGRFESLRLTRDGVCLEYTVAGTRVCENITATQKNDMRSVDRHFRIEPCDKSVVVVLGRKAEGEKESRIAVLFSDKDNIDQTYEENVSILRVPPHEKAIEFQAFLSEPCTLDQYPSIAPSPKSFGKKFDDNPSALRWPQIITTKVTPSTAKDAYVLDDIALPLDNPWKRNVRLADVQFFKDGTAAGVTLDGDVWIIRGLSDKSGKVEWKRFASGFHEPMSLAIRDGEIFVYDRNGIWRVRDTDGNGEADVHELFSNAFAQTAETREFPSSMKLAPDGSFVISKGGQQSTTLGKQNGMVLRVSPDGRYVNMLGWGFRGPFIGVNPKTGMVTASDQEGNYVPTTPLYIVKGGEYHGFLSQLLPKEKYPAPIADPLTWIPHPVNASGLTQVWLTDAKMGPLNDALVHIAYTRPELFLVLLNNRFPKPQAAVVSLTHNIEFAPLNGAVNPADGQLYVTGFRGWGTTAIRNSGLVRLRYTGAPSLFPREVVPMDKGVLLRFDVELDAKQAADLTNYSVERWNYRRTYKYGSPHLKLDGKPGQEWMPTSSVYLSTDNKSVFIGVPDMKRVMQMRVGWSLTSREGAQFESNAYFTPYEFAKFNPASEGFDGISVDMTPKAVVPKVSGPPSADEGKRLYEFLGCAACHSTDGSLIGHVGPSWKGLYGNKREFADGTHCVADEAYIRESILDPSAKVVKGFEKSESGMPNYGGVVTDNQIQSLILFIKSLK